MTKLNVCGNKVSKFARDKRLCRECNKPMSVNYFFHKECLAKFSDSETDGNYIYEGVGDSRLPTVSKRGGK